MVEYVLRKSCFVLAVVGVILQLAFAAYINNTAGEDINGQYLLDIGIKTNDLILHAIGLAITNHRHHRCSDWTPWTSCTARTPWYFGIKGRTRACSNMTSTAKTETDLSICRNQCPPDYNETTNGFCVKLHKLPKSQIEAENQCQTEGGHLINIDSQVKYEAIVELTAGFTPSYIHIGGRRKDVKSPWMMSGNGSQVVLFQWASGEPDNSHNALCLYLKGSNKLMIDGICSVQHPFLCEIRV